MKQCQKETANDLRFANCTFEDMPFVSCKSIGLNAFLSVKVSLEQSLE